MLNFLWSRENIPKLLRSVVTGTCKAWGQKQLLKSRTQVPSLKLFVGLGFFGWFFFFGGSLCNIYSTL